MKNNGNSLCDKTSKSRLVGVMQGRLLPKYKGRYQAHPIGYWQKEFPIAAELGVGMIEFILDYNNFLQNPLMNERGIEEIQNTVMKTQVVVHSVCADYFMEAPIHHVLSSVAEESQSVLKKLLRNCSQLGVRDIVIPCVDQSSFLHDFNARTRFFTNIQGILELAEKYEINLALETDLAPVDFAEFLSKFDSDRITVNYDIGNSAALGYNSSEELKAYGNRISDVHIKDRRLNGGSVELGTGNADFNAVFKGLANVAFDGTLIMQAFRDEEGLCIFKKQFDWIRPYLSL